MPLLRYYLPLLLLVASPTALAQSAACTDGTAQLEGSGDVFACDGVDLLAHLPLSDLGNSFASSDIWGWTDPGTGKEYALVGLSDRTAFVDVSAPESPRLMGTLKTHGGPITISIWRDLKVYDDHVYIVGEGSGHGMQVLDLTQLRDVASPPVTFTETAHYDGISSSHNIVINEESGFAYVVGAAAGTESSCSGGLHMVDLAEPAAPAFAGCFAEAGYTHDAQCIVYDGPDADYTGQEVCFAFNEDRVVIVDVTDKQNPAMISEMIYPNIGYTHQGWLTEDRRFLIGSDESDEGNFDLNTRTLVFDVSDLDDPAFRGAFLHDTEATDHNLYVKDNWVFQANYSSGFRLLDATSLLSGGSGSGLESVAYFDTYPDGDGSNLDGAWSVYPYFESGNVIVSDQQHGLFVLRPQVPGLVGNEAPSSIPPDGIALSEAYPNPFTSQTRLDLRVGSAQAVRVGSAQAVRAEAYDVLGRRVAVLFDGAAMADEVLTLRLEGAGLPAGTYLVRVTGEDFAETRRVSLVR